MTSVGSLAGSPRGPRSSGTHRQTTPGRSISPSNMGRHRGDPHKTFRNYSQINFLPALSFLDNVGLLPDSRGLTQLFFSATRLPLKSWSCPHCGEDNIEAEQKCGWCRSDRHPEAQVGQRLWRCTACSSVNAIEDEECQACANPDGMNEDAFHDVEIGSAVSEEDAAGLDMSISVMPSPVASPANRPQPWVCFQCCSVNIKPRCEGCGTERRAAEQWTTCRCGVAHALVATRSACIVCGTAVKHS
eukprot:EG_transcript_14972